jgi:uncharacterized protein
MDKYRVLAMDGGSMTGNGFVTAGLLQGMQAELGSDTPSFLDDVFLFSGTSAGAFNAAFLAKWEHPGDALPHIIEFWELIMNADNPMDGFSVCRIVNAVAGQAAFISTRKLETFFQDYFGDMRLGDLKQKVTISSFQLDNGNPKLRTWKPKIFNNFDGDPDCDEKVADVLMRSSSPPLVDPVYQGYVDGGIVANNPSMIALAEVLTRVLHKTPDTLPDIVMLSIGNARIPKYLETLIVNNVTDWGYQKWLLNPSDPLALLTMFMDAGTLTVNYECARLLGNRFFRIDPYLLKSLGVTNGAQVVPAVEKFLADPVTRDDLKDAASWLHSSGWVAKSTSHKK